MTENMCLRDIVVIVPPLYMQSRIAEAHHFLLSRRSILIRASKDLFIVCLKGIVISISIVKPNTSSNPSSVLKSKSTKAFLNASCLPLVIPQPSKDVQMMDRIKFYASLG